MATIKGGDKFEAALKRIASKLSGPQPVLRVGFLEGAKYPDGTLVAMVAAINEYGRKIQTKDGIKYQPPRPFFRNMVAAKSDSWPKGIATQLKKNDYDVEKTLQIVGEVIAGQLRQSILDTNSPPLAPSTIKAKGFTKPLVDTGHMLNSVDFEIKKP